MNKLEEVERSLSLTIFPDSYAKTKKETHLSFGELIIMLENMPTVKNKEDCIYIKLAEFGDTKTPKKCLRYDKNVVSVSGCEIDYDAGVMTVDEAAKIFEANDIESFIYTSASHTKEKPRWRALFPFSEDITGTTEEMKKGRARMVRRVDNLLGGLAANESYTLSQSFYFGVVGAKEEAGLFDMYHSKGRYIDQCDELPDEIPNSKAPSKTAAPVSPQIAGVLDNLSGVEPVKGVYTRFDFDKVFDGFSNDTYHQGIVSLTSHYAGSKMPLKDIIANVGKSMLTHGEVGSVKYNLRFDEIPDRAQSAIDKFNTLESPDVLGEIKPMDTKHLMANKPADPPELIQGVIPYSVFGLVGTGGVAKSTFALYVSICLASGHEVLECRQPPIGVLYLSGEDEESQILPRLYDLIDALDLNEEEQENLNKNFHFKDLTGAMVRLVETDSSNNIVITAFTDQLIEAYQPHNIKLLWVDPTGFFGAGERLVNDGEMALMQAGRRISKGLGGAAVGFIHHVSKEAARNKFTDQHAGRGGSAFADNSRAMLVMNVYTGKDKDGDKPPIDLIENDPNIVEDLRLVQLNVAKYSYGMRNPRPYWITRSAINPFDLNIITPPSGAEARKIAAEHRKADQAKKVEDKKLDVIALLYLIEKRIAEHLPVTKTQLEKCDEVEIHKSISRANLRSAYERAESKGLILKTGGGSNTKITLHENWRGMAGCALEPLLWAAENSKNASLYPATPPYHLNNTSGGGVGRG
jgi:RecA-family ATPase